ncbi:hypothetical protein K491DRAFT_761625 [Lophiostoma macrostomum CBS 122681]|uniref:Apple domain-containing protein n=1 Tax=Lophiostoma macrostomum CBS 122681 TaxID=1314788 RepID=A0A6A6SUC0_9PLEO|nr:hypothetical protein K491DRAFT_761625 [Lophiostoma macrostomum CBS 122681]
MSITTLLVGFLAIGAASFSIKRAETFPPVPSSINRLALACPTDNTIKTWDNSTFSCASTTNLAAGDVTGIIAYSVKDCADACATASRFLDGGCDAFTLDADLARSYSINNGANCWLKRQSDIDGETRDYNGVSGKLIDGRA